MNYGRVAGVDKPIARVVQGTVMIRSGWHAEWDAALASSRARAEYAARLEAMARAFAPVHRAIAGMGVSAKIAAERLKAATAAWNRNPPR